MVSCIDSVTRTDGSKWRKVKREAHARLPVSVQPDDVAARHRTFDGGTLNVRRADPMGVDDAIAWQACLDGDFERLHQALAHTADPNFRGPTYDCGTLLHMACAGGHVRCARLLVEGFASDPRAKDREGRTPLDFLQQRPDLRHMQRLLQDSVDELHRQQQDKQAKTEVAYRARREAEGGDALKGWVLRFAQSSERTHAIVVNYQDGPAVLKGRRTKELVLALWNETNGGWQTKPGTLSFTDDLHYTLIRRATSAELAAAGVEKGVGFEAQVALISVRHSSVHRNLADKYTTYSFDVMLGDEVLHTISDRYDLPSMRTCSLA